MDAYTDCLNNPNQIRAGYVVPANPIAQEDSLPATLTIVLPPNPLLPLNVLPPTIHTLYILAFEHVTDDTPSGPGHWEVTYTSCKPPHLTTQEGN